MPLLKGAAPAYRYVSRYDYYRTEHNSQRSPPLLDVVHKCQNCCNDRQCEAFHKNLHLVQHCVHDDHNMIPHHRQLLVGKYNRTRLKISSPTSVYGSAITTLPEQVRPQQSRPNVAEMDSLVSWREMTSLLPMPNMSKEPSLRNFKQTKSAPPNCLRTHGTMTIPLRKNRHGWYLLKPVAPLKEAIPDSGFGEGLDSKPKQAVTDESRGRTKTDIEKYFCPQRPSPSFDQETAILPLIYLISRHQLKPSRLPPLARLASGCKINIASFH